MHCNCREHAVVDGRCSACGRAVSALVYAPFCATVGGLAGSLAGFTLMGTGGALALGLVGILVGELGGRWLLRPRSTVR